MLARKPYYISIVTMLLTLGLAPWFGAIDLSLAEVFSLNSNESSIFFQLRLPQTLLAFLVGASLGVAGLVYQALFRNPLATPYTLGVASGASLGAVLSLYLGTGASLYFISLTRLGGFIGALACVMFLFIFAGIYSKQALSSLLLIGVALGFLCSSLILFLQYCSSPTQGYITMRWLMGGLETVGYSEVVELSLVLVVVFCFLLRFKDELDLLSIDEDIASAAGVRVYSTQLYLLASVSILVGIAVSIAGPIGFIGLVVPHMVRIYVGPKHSVLLPLVFCFAGCFLVICDTLSRIIIAPSVLPVGIITSLLGAPFFLMMLLRRSSS